MCVVVVVMCVWRRVRRCGTQGVPTPCFPKKMDDFGTASGTLRCGSVDLLGRPGVDMEVALVTG